MAKEFSTKVWRTVLSALEWKIACDRGKARESMTSLVRLQPLQKVRLQQTGQGSEFPKRESNRPPLGIRFASHQPRPARSIGTNRGHPRAQTRPGRSQGQQRRTAPRLTNKVFRRMDNEDAMATERLAEASTNSTATHKTRNNTLSQVAHPVG